MDLARAYDYSDVNNSEVEWYTAPRCLFFRDGQTNGYWTSPYFDAGAGNINMVTYSQPMYSGKKFLGIATIDIEVDALCFGNQCSKICAATEYGYNISSKCNKYNVRDILYFSKTPGCPVLDPNPTTVACTYVPRNSTPGLISILLGAMGAAISIAVLVLLIIFRKRVLIKASQVNICYGYVLGSILANLGSFVLVGEYTQATCVLKLWAIILPMTILLAFLFGKVYRVYLIFFESKCSQAQKVY